MVFLYPQWFLLLLPLAFFFLKKKNRSTSNFRTPAAFLWDIPTPRDLSPLIPWCRFFTLACLTLVLARPQTYEQAAPRKADGLDMILVIDTSGSMKALDFLKGDGRRVDRLSVVKEVVSDFVKKRINDRLGLVVFGSQAYPQAPLTLDHEVILTYIDAAQIGMAGEATAIGDGIGVALGRVKDVDAKSKILILLTDGANTAGKIDPRQAMEAAKTLGVKIYTIGIGSDQPVPVETQWGIQQVVFELDEKLLTEIAQETGGSYFKASDREGLAAIYDEIDRLETTQREGLTRQDAKEEYGFFLLLALGFFLLEMLLWGRGWKEMA
jgi:Ca-activated chloride channel family protein